MDWSFKDRRLLVAGRPVALPRPPREVLPLNGMLVVLLDVPPNEVMTENVVGVSADGTVAWQIQKIASTGTNPVNCYTALSQSDDRTFRAVNWNGTDVDVDVATGRVVGERFTK